MSTAAIVGAGAWGTALADLVARNGHRTVLWARETDVVADVNANHTNTRFLKGVALSPALTATDDLAAALSAASLITFVAPSHVLRAVIRSAAHAVRKDATLIVATKGIERETFALMTDIVADELPGRSVVALSGPSFAAEVAQRQPTAVVAASRDESAALRTQQLFSSAEFRVYTQRDVVGVVLEHHQVIGLVGQRLLAGEYLLLSRP